MIRRMKYISLNFSYYFEIIEMRIMGFCYTARNIFKNRKMPRKLSRDDLKKMHRHFKEAEKKNDTKI